MVQDLNCEQMRVSGCNKHYKSVLSAGAKAKSVTNPLIIPTVLSVGFWSFFIFSYFFFNGWQQRAD
jgi:hypothetical protein